jgi:hypothetical protein
MRKLLLLTIFLVTGCASAHSPQNTCTGRPAAMRWAEWDRVSLARVTGVGELFTDAHGGKNTTHILAIRVDRVFKGDSADLPTKVIEAPLGLSACGGDDMSTPRIGEALVVYERRKRPKEDALTVSRRVSWAGKYDRALRKALK